jgi:hypothetical protein
MPSGGYPVRRRIEVFFNEAMLIEAAKIFRWMSHHLVLGPELAVISSGQMDDDPARPKDPFITAALCETVALVSRTSLRVAREASRAVEPYWLDVGSPEELWLLFDND